jgi:short-subunit dehydrogenase
VPSTAKTHTIIITGASSGIGRALATLAASERFRVLLVARRGERLGVAATEIRAAGGVCATLVADVIAPDAPQRIIDAAIKEFGRIDVVVNNAGAGALGRLLEIDDAEIEAQWQLHVAAPLRIARAALPQLRTTEGQLVFVGSGLARVPIPNYGAYAPAKAAIRAVATQLRRELQREGIAVTYVDPGLVATEFHQAMGTARTGEIPAADPHVVAKAILRGIVRRSAVVSGTPWQTAGTVMAEWSGVLGDKTLIKMAPKSITQESSAGIETAPEITKSQAPAAIENATLQSAESAKREGAPTHNAITSVAPTGDGANEGPPLDLALEPVARRMERVKLTPAFIRDSLTPDATLELNEVAMRWAGMPNKNERAVMREVFDALTAAGYLHQTGDETWKVLRAAN